MRNILLLLLKLKMLVCDMVPYCRMFREHHQSQQVQTQAMRHTVKMIDTYFSFSIIIMLQFSLPASHQRDKFAANIFMVFSQSTLMTLVGQLTFPLTKPYMLMV